MNPIRILIAEDHSLVRAGFCALLSEFENVVIVAEASNGREALSLIEEHRPDIALLDIAMPELNGLEVAKQLTKDFPKVKAIILSMYANEEYVLRAIQAGAMGYLLKDANLSELELAIRSVAKGEMYFSPRVSKTVIEAYLRRIGNSVDLEGMFGDLTEILTPRQREILQLIAEGHTSQAIATRLQISVKTVETHRAELMRRLNIYDVAGLVRYALRKGMIDPES